MKSCDMRVELTCTPSRGFVLNPLVHKLTALTLILLTPLCALGTEPTKQDVDFFEKKIRPVLVKKCYECHSSQAKELGGKLLLDTHDGIKRGGESGSSYVIGNPDKSLIIQAIRYQDTEMPPKDPLPDAVINDFVEWVKRGAPYGRDSAVPLKPAIVNKVNELDRDRHWSFFPRKIVAAPAVADQAWPRGQIDRFVLAKIEAEKLAPAGDAPPATLVRRLYFDLLGLPPSAKQVEEFQNAYRADGQLAVTRLVDKLLAMPQFGERWGRHWLDVARYGESNGDDGLGRNASFPHAWQYRDYVIQSFNDDVPYDRFLMEQIAGDLLPAKSAKERNRNLVATGFLAIGAKPAAAMNNNFAMDIVDDQINVVSSAIMGLSVSCARCHDHKHDPIPTRDYYAMAGIFRSTETLYGRAANEKLTAPPTKLHELVSEFSSEQRKPVLLRETPRFPETYSEVIQKQNPHFFSPLDVVPKAWKIEGTPKFTSDHFASVNNVRLVGEIGDPADSYSVSFWFKNDIDNNQRPITAYLFSRGGNGTSKTGDHLGIGGTHDKSLTGRLFVFNGSDTKQSIGGNTVIPKGSWNHVVVVRKGNRLSLYLNGVEEAEFDGPLPTTYGDSKTYTLASRADKFAPLQGSIGMFAIFGRALNESEVRLLHKASGQPRGVRAARPVGVAMGVRERAKPADCKVHINGQTGKFGPVAPRGFLTVYQSSWKSGAAASEIAAIQSGRLQLAKWLTRTDHPQTARVMVNRIWLHLFGDPIVSTPDDFGVYGARPTHPKLLDHLAHTFVQEGWSIKRLIRMIVLSRTYQLDSRCNEQLWKADPERTLLTHHRRRRLDAESLRDSLLSVAGTLDLTPGQGSAVEKTDILINWPPGESTNLHRESNHRSIYLCMLRHAPPPELAAFDLPDPLKTIGQRDVTTLPAQTLFLLNSPFVIEQAATLATTLLANDDQDDPGRVSDLYRMTLQRVPTQEEQYRAIRYLQAIRSTLPPKESNLKAWASLCQSVLASSEFRYID